MFLNESVGLMIQWLFNFFSLIDSFKQIDCVNDSVIQSLDATGVMMQTAERVTETMINLDILSYKIL